MYLNLIIKNMDVLKGFIFLREEHRTVHLNYIINLDS